MSKKRVCIAVLCATLFIVLMASFGACCCKGSVKNERGEEDCGIVFKRIGVVHSPYTSGKKAPRQGKFAPDVESLIVMEPGYEMGLKDIETFSHIIVFYVFDRVSGWDLLVQTPWDKKRHGVFATRTPRRPNPIGFTVVKLVKHSGSNLYVRGLDALDGTPVIDLKPYIPRFDAFEDASEGWLGGKGK